MDVSTKILKLFRNIIIISSSSSLTAIGLSLGASIPYTSTDKKTKNKYTEKKQ